MPSNQVTITGKLTDVSGAAQTGQVVFTLVNCGAQPPVIVGSDVIAQLQVTALAASDGTWSATLFLNSAITPLNTFYTVAISPAGSTAPVISSPYLFNTAGTFDLSNLTPLVTIPGPSFVSIPTLQGATGAAGAAGATGATGAPGTSNVPWLDIQDFGGIPKPSASITSHTTVNTTSGLPTISVGSALPYFLNGAGVCIWQAGAATAQSTPSAPTVTSPPVQGSQTITYAIAGVDSMGGLTAASSSATVTNAPAIFGPKAVAISSASASGGVVTLNFASALNNTVTANMTIHVVGLTGSGASWNGVWTIASAPTTSQITYAVSGATGTGTVTNATGRVSNVAIITALSRSSTGVITVTTSQTHNFVVGTVAQPTIVIIEGVSPLNLCGHYVLGSTPTANTFTCNTGNLVAATGILNTNGASQHNFLNVATATVYEFIQLACPALSGTTTQYYIYSDSANPGGPLALIGKTLYPESHFIDYGPSVAGGFRAPAYIPTTAPSAAQNQMFSTTILSGGGTTSLTLAANVPSSVTVGTILYDDSPCLLAASNQITGGQLLLSPPTAPGSVASPMYIFNSPITLSQGLELVVSSAMWINETIYQENYVKWSGNMASVAQTAPAFSAESRPTIQGMASPMIQVGLLTASQVSGFVFDGLAINLTLNNINGIYGLSVFGGFYGKIKNCSFISGTGTAGGTNVPLVINGNSVNIEMRDLLWEGGNSYPNSPTVGQGSWVPCIGSIVIRSSDNPNQNTFQPDQIYLKGVNNAADRGILIDNTYGNGSTCNAFEFENVWNQAPVTPMIMFFGSSAGASDVKIHRIQMDSQPTAVLANWTNIQNVKISNCFASSQTGIVTGNYINGLQLDGWAQQATESLISNGPVNVPGQTRNVVTRQYIKFNVGSVAASNAPGNVLETNTNAQSLGASGVIFAPVVPPTPTATASGVGTFTAGTWLVGLAHVGWDGGESAIGPATTVVVNGSQGIQVSWTVNPGFQGYYIYFVLKGSPTATRSTTLYTSSPATIASLGSVTGDGAFADGTGLPLINGTGIFTQQLAITSGSAPATSTSTGIPGQIAWDATHIYVCVSTNTWVRATLATF